jgi:uncharacterized protein
MPSLDTNILLRIILKDVPTQLEKAEALIANNKVLAIDDLAITETVFVLEKVVNLDRPSISELILSLVNNQFIDMNGDVIAEALEYFLEFRSLSFNDCYLAAKAKGSKKTPLYTFDKSLAKNLPKLALEP